MRFSIIIPVYNRPDELEELLESIKDQDYDKVPEVIVVEDGSEVNSKSVVDQYGEFLNINYCFKKNTGPGDSRNYGMQRASGNYFILLDSDCILPKNYLTTIDNVLDKEFLDAFGGPDAAHESFSSWQKAINYSMTSFLTTGGLRSEETSKRKFQLRSFNMGLSKKVFDQTGGFSKQRIGEDIDLNFKLLELGLSTRLIPEAFVYHKRRSSVTSFYRQTRNFGAARPILNRMHSGSAKITYWFPSLFLIGLIAAIGACFLGLWYGLILYGIYLLILAVDAFIRTRSLVVSFLSIISSLTQFLGYGSGFLRSMYRLVIRRMEIREAFPGMFS